MRVISLEIAVKRSALVLILLATGTINATAADMPVKAKPVPSPIPSWTGFYAGLNAGYGWADASSINNPLDPTTQFFLSPASDFNAAFRQSGWIAGGQIGANWQFADRGVFGIEADLQFANVEGSGSVARRPQDVAVVSTGERELRWFGTLRGRLGFLATPNLLLYGTGGLAYGEATSRGHINNVSGVSIAFAGNTQLFCRSQSTCYIGSSSDTQAGWTAGIGGEWKFSANWSAKLEYLHVELPATSVTLVSPPPSDPGFATAFRFNRQAYDFVRVGVNYQWGGAPLVAKY
jgi:outer membrane immunogenic protein